MPDRNDQGGEGQAELPAILCIRCIEPDGPTVRCTTDRDVIHVPRVPASYLRCGDVVRVVASSSPVQEFLSTREGLQRNVQHVYFGRVGYAAAPKVDPRNEHFVLAEASGSELGIRSLHLPNQAIREYFYGLGAGSSERTQSTLYEMLHTTPTVTPADLRLSYRIIRLEYGDDSTFRPDTRRAERAFNILANPILRACYDALLKDPNAPAMFPYGGFGQCVAAGALADDGHTFFVRRILCYLPDQRERKFRVPLRRVQYVAGLALYRDSRRKAEVYLDSSILPLARLGCDLESVEAPGSGQGRHRGDLRTLRQISTRWW
jgi:hypothetical protein